MVCQQTEEEIVWSEARHNEDLEHVLTLDPQDLHVAVQEAIARTKAAPTTGAEPVSTLMKVLAEIGFGELKKLTHQVAIVGSGGLPGEKWNWTRKTSEAILHGHEDSSELRKYVDTNTLAANHQGDKVAFAAALELRKKSA